MAFEYFYAAGSDGNVIQIDNETGEYESLELAEGDTAVAVERDLDGNIYVNYDSHLRKFTVDLTEDWHADSDDLDRATGERRVKYNSYYNSLFIGGDNYCRIDSDTGDPVWEVGYSVSMDTRDITYNPSDDWIGIHQLDDYEDLKVDPGSGSDDDDVMTAGYNTDSYAFVWYAGFLYVADENGNILRENSFDRASSWVSIGDDGWSNIEVDFDGVIVGQRNGSVIKVLFDETVEWEIDISSDDIISIDVGPDAVWAASSTGDVWRIDPDTGDVVWEHESILATDTDQYSIGGFPSLDMVPDEDWEVPTVEISGATELNDGSVENVEVIIIDDENEEFVERVTSDSDGNWSADVREGTYHIIAQYEDIAGDQYNTETYPYITLGEE